jgi:hypothetical protein
MSPLSMYLWKEWREQRATLGVLAAVLLAGVAAVVLALPGELASDPLAFQGAVALSVLATVMSIGADLLARERAGAGLGFLERLPAGLGTAFRAKLVFFTLALAAAALYGALLATAAALVCAGEWPHGVLDAPWWLALLIGVSLWVFAVSAWVPASALTFPGALLLLVVLAWPAVLAVKGDALFRPTPLEGLAFAALCLVGAPTSAWAAFVFGSRLGRSRFRAALAGLVVALVFFAPAWAWAGGRYASLKNAPFEVLTGWVGPNGRYAFLDLVRKPPHGIAKDAERTTALVVDLESGAWKFAGDVDASGFVQRSDRHGLSREDEARAPLELMRSYSALAASEGIAFDPLTARALTREEEQASLIPGIGPRDFGLSEPLASYQVRRAGLGHRLRYKDGRRFRELYRDVDGRRVIDAATFESAEAGRALYWIRVRSGCWLARTGNRWVALDPATGEHRPLEHVGPDEQVGPLLDDGRVVLVAPAGMALLDPDSGERTALRLLGDPRFELRMLSDGAGDPWSALPSTAPCVVLVSGKQELRWALLDARTGTLELASSVDGLPRALWTSPPVVIVLEDYQRIVRLDLRTGAREQLFSVENLR